MTTPASDQNDRGKSLWALRPIDWKWVGMGYCYFVVFHMLPTFFLSTGAMTISFRGFGFLPGLWVFFGLAFVGYIVGRRSRGITIIEPGISGLLYAVTLFLNLGKLTGNDFSLRTVGYTYLITVAIFLTSVVSAWLGERVQQRAEEKASQTAS